MKMCIVSEEFEVSKKKFVIQRGIDMLRTSRGKIIVKNEDLVFDFGRIK